MAKIAFRERYKLALLKGKKYSNGMRLRPVLERV
jgi:hypothetical protein